MNNKKLFYYGWIANIKKAFGLIIFIIGLSSGFYNFWYFGLVPIGFYLFATGASQRFDYQRQSGNIIHKGDW